MKWMMFLGLVLLVAPVRTVAAQAGGVDSTRVHIVRPGDTLWDLARQYLRNPFLWPEIFSVNRGTVVDPHLIYPQARLRIPPGRTAATQANAGVVAGAGTGNQPLRNATGRTVFFTGEGQRGGRTSSVVPQDSQAVAVVPPGSFYSAGVLLPEAELPQVGRLVEVLAPTVLDRGTAPQIHPHDRVFVRITGAGVSLGERLQVVRPGREVRPYGRVYHPTGSGRVLDVEAGVATLEIDQLYDRIDIGHLVVTTPEYDVPVGVVPSTATGLEGQLLAFRSAGPIASTEDVAFVNLGAASGVVVGDEYEAYLPATQEAWGRRPEIVVARLQVIRVTERTSAVRVVTLDHPTLREGLPVRLVARMP